MEETTNVNVNENTNEMSTDNTTVNTVNDTTTAKPKKPRTKTPRVNIAVTEDLKVLLDAKKKEMGASSHTEVIKRLLENEQAKAEKTDISKEPNCKELYEHIVLEVPDQNYRFP